MTLNSTPGGRVRTAPPTREAHREVVEKGLVRRAVVRDGMRKLGMKIVEPRNGINKSRHDRMAGDNVAALHAALG